VADGFPTQLKSILYQEGRRQSWLAERAGLTESRMSYIVNGLRPSEDEARRIAEALGRDSGDVFPTEAAA